MAHEKSNPIRLLIADDHPVVRLGLVTMINAQPDMRVEVEAAGGAAAVKAFDPERIDIGLVDLRMPEMNGVEVIAAIRRNHPKARLIVLTTYDSDEDIHRALEAGAMGYIIKAMPYQVLIEAIRRVSAGKRYIPDSVSRQLADRLPDSELTPREHEVLTLIVKGKSNREIATDLGITEGTVKCHVNVILGRLGVSARTQAAVAALQRGIVHL
ncbi:MAG: response regulator transcription factor [Terracidiphilus sp.]|jgi:DNA-binding NarL/FixJ family response regulator